MKQKIISTSIYVVFLLMVCTMVLMVGCSSGSLRVRKQLVSMPNSQLKMVLEKNLAATGGMDNWLKVRQLTANALSTILSRGGGRSLVQEVYKVDLSKAACSIAETSYEPGGALQEILSSSGSIKISRRINGKNLLYKADQLAGAAVRLRLLLQGFTGARGLLHNGVSLRYAGLDRKEGKLFHKVEVTGNLLPDGKTSGKNCDLLVLWFNTRSFQLDRLWLRYHLKQKTNTGNAVGYIAARVLGYKTVDMALDGSHSVSLKLPEQIEISYSNSYQQFSSSDIFILDISSWQGVVGKQH